MLDDLAGTCKTFGLRLTIPFFIKQFKMGPQSVFDKVTELMPTQKIQNETILENR